VLSTDIEAATGLLRAGALVDIVAGLPLPTL